MRILHVTPTYRPTLGGIEAVIECLCRELRRNGVVSDVAHIAPGLAYNLEDDSGASVYRIPLRGHPFFGLAPKLVQVARDYDLLHVHDPQLLAISASVIFFARHKPAVLSTHGGFRHTKRFSRAKALHERFAMPRMLRCYTRILASSRSDYDQFERVAEEVYLTENGVDVSRFAAIPGAWDRSPWRWVFWGRIARHKRLDLVVDLAGRARSLGYPVELVICGDDFDGTLPALQSQTARVGASWIKLLPGMDDDRLATLIGRSGLFVTASEYEGFGLTVIEAMAAGLAVVCRDIAPLSGFVDDANGLLLDFDESSMDTERLTEFLARLGGNWDQLRRKGKDRAAQYGWERRVSDFLGHYSSILKA